MTDLKRYDISFYQTCYGIELVCDEENDGNYVMYEDVKQLEAELKEARVENIKLTAKCESLERVAHNALVEEQ